MHFINTYSTSKMHTSIAVLLFAFHIAAFASGQKTADKCKDTEKLTFSYGTENKNGPPKWKEKNSVCDCKRKEQKQSPINLVQPDQKKPNETDFKFVGYDKPLKGSIKNTGTNLILYPTDKKERYIEVNGERCDLKHIVFHFGENSTSGTYHQIDGKKFALEVDMANECESGDAIVAILLQERDKATPKVQNLAEAAGLVTYRGQRANTRKPINLMNLTSDYCYYPKDGSRDADSFYVYEGSYMYPPCTENVTWIVMSQPSPIAKDLMENFRQLRATRKGSEEECYLYPNNRGEIVPTNSRYISPTIGGCGTKAKKREAVPEMRLGSNTRTAGGDLVN